jgi:hypothetical protein
MRPHLALIRQPDACLALGIANRTPPSETGQDAKFSLDLMVGNLSLGCAFVDAFSL